MDDLVKDARAAYEDAVEADRANRQEAVRDLEFLAGKQWPDVIRRERERSGRPMLTLSRLNQYERQITGDMRLNPPAIKVRPVDSGADPATAKTFTGLIRNIEAQTGGQRAYLTAGANAVRCGEGWFGLLYDYAPDSFDMELRFRRFASPFAVVPAPDAQEPTCADASYMFVHSLMPVAAFREAYPKASLADWDNAGLWGNWREGEYVRIAEWWRRVPVRRRLLLLADMSVVDVTGKEDAEIAAIVMQGGGLLREREAEGWRVEMRKMTGVEEIEPVHHWPGCMIPLVRCVGEEISVGDRIVRFGIVRPARDAQSLYNIQRTAMAEAVAMAPKAKWMVTARQVQGQEARWAAANISNEAVLIYTPDERAPGPPQRVAPEMPSGALLADVQAAAQDIEATIGLYRENLGKESNAVSGKAILSRQREGDTGTYLFMDNLSEAVIQAGRILINVLPKVYDTERQVRVMGEDGKEEFVFINRRIVDPLTGEVKRVNDLSAGRYDVVASVGPSFSTKREEEREFLMTLVQAAPTVGEVAADVIVGAMDSPGAEEVAKRLRKIAIAKGYAEPGEGDPPPPPPQPSPEILLAQAEMAKVQAQMAKAQVDAQVEAERLALDRERVGLEREKIKAQQAQVMIEASRADREREEAAVRARNDTEATRAKTISTIASVVDKAVARQSEQLAARMEQRERQMQETAIAPLGQGMERLTQAMQTALARVEEVARQAQAIGARLEHVAAQVTAPREIVRDPKTGRPVGVRIGNQVRRIERGPDGKAVGLQ